MNSPVPLNLLSFPNGEIGVSWSDGREDFISARWLRGSCPCAACVDELTGVRKVYPEQIDPGIKAEAFSPVGRYAVSVLWSDGHDSGIYTFDALRELCKAEAGRQSRPASRGEGGEW